jgi:hypothetical protein
MEAAGGISTLSRVTGKGVVDRMELEYCDLLGG